MLERTSAEARYGGTRLWRHGERRDLRLGRAQHGEQARRDLPVRRHPGLGLEALDRVLQRRVAAAARVDEAELLEDVARLVERDLIVEHAL